MPSPRGPLSDMQTTRSWLQLAYEVSTNNATYNIYGDCCFIEPSPGSIPAGGEILVSYGRVLSAAAENTSYVVSNGTKVRVYL